MQASDYSKDVAHDCEQGQECTVTTMPKITFVLSLDLNRFHPNGIASTTNPRPTEKSLYTTTPLVAMLFLSR